MSWKNILKLSPYYQSNEIDVAFYNSDKKVVEHKLPMDWFIEKDIAWLSKKEQSKLITDYLKERPHFDFKGGLKFNQVRKDFCENCYESINDESRHSVKYMPQDFGKSGREGQSAELCEECYDDFQNRSVWLIE